jgi:anti-sigma regulatory factor (Ser/Thr protein kinase)
MSGAHVTTQARRTFTAGLLELRQIPVWMTSVLAEGGLADQQINELMTRVELAVQELCVNIVTHAYGGRPGKRLELIVRLEAHEFTVEVIDDGPEFDPTDLPAPNLDDVPVHGFGVSIISALTTSFAVARVQGRNRSRLTFAVPAAPAGVHDGAPEGES